MRKEDVVLILGGGFGGARLAQELSAAGFDSVTLIDRKDYFEVTYSMLRTLVGPDIGERARIQYHQFLKSNYLQKEVTQLNRDHVVFADGATKRFHVAVVATGSSYPTFPLAKSQKALTLSERKIEIAKEHERLVSASNVLIIGGGTVGVELAGEIADHFPEKKVTITESKDRLLSNFRPKASSIAKKLLTRLGVYVVLNTKLEPDSVIFEEADIVYRCVGAYPNTELLSPHLSSLLDAQRRIKVDLQLRVEEYR